MARFLLQLGNCLSLSLQQRHSVKAIRWWLDSGHRSRRRRLRRRELHKTNNDGDDDDWLDHHHAISIFLSFPHHLYIFTSSLSRLVWYPHFAAHTHIDIRWNAAVFVICSARCCTYIRNIGNGGVDSDNFGSLQLAAAAATTAAMSSNTRASNLYFPLPPTVEYSIQNIRWTTRAQLARKCSARIIFSMCSGGQWAREKRCAMNTGLHHETCL